MDSVMLVLICDVERIKALLSKQNLYKGIMNNTYHPDTHNPKTDTVAWYMCVNKQNKIEGLLAVERKEDKLYFHGGIYKEFRGKDSYLRLRKLLDKVKFIYEAKELYTTSDKNNKLAQIIIKKCNFKETHTDNNIIYYKEVV